MFIAPVTMESEIREFLRGYDRRVINNPSLTTAGVLILLFELEGSLHILFTKRTDFVEHHKGQVSFPGGVRDDSDPDIVATALREAEEEVGLPADSIEILGIYDDFATPTGFVITPAVGYISRLPRLEANNREVEEILEVPVDFFLNPQNERVVEMERNGRLHDVYFYTYRNGIEIWGATAFILRSFLKSIFPQSALS